MKWKCYNFARLFLLLTGISVLTSYCKPKVKDFHVEPPKKEVKNFSTRTESKWDGSRITGTVYNLNDKHISFVSVDFVLTDKNMMPIQTVSASNAKGIEPNGKWEFDISANNLIARNIRLKSTIVK